MKIPWEVLKDMITEATGASKETIRRINVGETFKDQSLSYPLRNL